MTRESKSQSEGPTNNAAQGYLSAALSGSLSGAAISACVQPLDVIRTRMQADATRNALSGAVGTLRKVVSEEGVRALWNGTGPTIVRLSVGLGLQMCVLESLKEAFRWRHVGLAEEGTGHSPGKLTKLEAFLCGGLARTVAAAATCPFTLVKTRMEYTGGSRSGQGMVSMIMSIARQEGAVGLFRGLGPTIITNAPYSAFYYLFYTSLKERLQQHGAPQAAINFSSGTVAAIAATLLTQPTDMLRTHMQLGLAGKGNVLGLRETWNAVVGGKMGHRVLLVGVAPRVYGEIISAYAERQLDATTCAVVRAAATCDRKALKRTLQTALVWTVYEELQPRLKQALSRASPK